MFDDILTGTKLALQVLGAAPLPTMVVDNLNTRDFWWTGAGLWDVWGQGRDNSVQPRLNQSTSPKFNAFLNVNP